jgi:hypothetical protein
MVPYNGSSVDVEQLKQMYKLDDAARVLLDHFAGFQRNRKQTTVDRVLYAVRREGHDLTRGDVVRIFKALSECGCGDFVAGRWNHPSRFEWEVSLVEVGRAAAGEDTKVEAISSEEPEESEEQGSDVLAHSFVLRPGAPPVILELPSDLSAREAARLGEFIKTLPFSE